MSPAPQNMNGFQLSHSDFGRVGHGLSRPECVLVTACGDLYVSDARGGVSHIAADGSCRLISGQTLDGKPLGANGFAMLRDGSFLVAPLAGGGVYRLYRDGRSDMFLSEVQGRPMDCPNFVLLDDRDRIWICCLTQQPRSNLSRYSRQKRDGFIVLVDDQGARIVAENIGYPNEVRIDPTGRYLYTNETLAARLLRYPLHEDGSLGPMEVIASFDESHMFDGFTLDSEGGAWITALISNRIIYVGTDGRVRVLIEDFNPEQLQRLAQMQKTSGVERELLYEEHGARLRNPSSVAFGGKDWKTAYVGSLMGEEILTFQSPVAGMRPAHWDFGPFA